MNKHAYVEGYTYTTSADWLKRYEGNKLYSPKFIEIKENTEVYTPNPGRPKTNYVNKEAGMDDLAIEEMPDMVNDAIDLIFKEAPGNIGKLFLKKDKPVVDYDQSKLLDERGNWFEAALKKFKAIRERNKAIANK
jgi:hypothetical protein